MYEASWHHAKTCEDIETSEEYQNSSQFSCSFAVVKLL